MNIIDGILVVIILLVLLLAFYFTRSKKKDGCAGCHSECNSCHAFTDLYKNYKKDGMDKK